METQNINVAPNNEGTDKKSEKTLKAKQVAGNAVKFTAAAGIGSVGTIVADAVNLPNEDDNSENPLIDDTAREEETASTEPEILTQDFNPNDIVIEEVEEVTDVNVGDGSTIAEGNEENDDISEHDGYGDSTTLVEPRPITTEDTETPSSEEELIVVNVDDTDGEYILTDGWTEPEIFDPDIFEGDNTGDMTEIEPVYDDTPLFSGESGCTSEGPSLDDILGDILNA